LEMETHSSNGKDGEKKLKNRFMDKLFKERKTTTEQDAEQDVDSFLRGPSDKLYMMPTSENASQTPHLTRIDTSTARRWPTAAEINNSRRRRSTSPRRSRKGLVVRFTDEQPEVIGEGGDEATSPVADIGARRRAHSHPPIGQPGQGQKGDDRRDIPPPDYKQESREQPRTIEQFQPMRRTQTGAESIPNIQNIPTLDKSSTLPAEGEQNIVLRTKSHDPTSFAARARAEMQADEGRALVRAASKSSHVDQLFARADSPLPADIESTPELNELHLNTMNNTHIPPTSSVPTQLEPGRPQGPIRIPSSNSLNERPTVNSQSSTFTMQEAAMAVGDDALQDFSRRSAHLFTLFRLAAESVKPLPKCSPQELVRVALWWFLKGRLSLEASIRERPTTPEGQQANLLVRQQAHGDLAKALWIIETFTTQYPELSRTISSGLNTPVTDILDSWQSIMSNLKKLTISMKRNNILPPNSDDAPLPQGLDNTIWLSDDGDRSLVTSQRFNSVFSLSESFSLGDSSQNFHYGRMFAEAVLLEESESQYYRCHVLLSILRGQKEKSLTVTVASQDGLFNIGIQNDRARGPTWEDVTWQSEINTLEVKLPRGFVLRLHCVEQDFRALWGLYDLHGEIYAILEQRRDEELIFEATVRTFQQFELTPNAVSPKEPLPHCHMRVFEKSIVQKAATGARTMHRGFRLGLCTNPKTKNLKGVDRTLPPNLPIQFGFLRGEGGLPALLLQSSDEKSKHNIVFTFEDVSERTRLHTLLTGVALREAEDVIAEAPIKSFAVTNRSHDDRDSKCLKYLDWQSLRVINETYGEVCNTKTVLSEHLRIVLDFKAGTLTDRVNVGPGELKLRLDVNSSNQLSLFRQPQQDMTISVSESQVLKELPGDLALLLRSIARSETTRTYTFPTVKDLHLFQTALTGFAILFDGIAASFNISRRRMVVPIYKKWDAATTRVQLIQKERVVQLVAFFEDFSHGDCMNFTLKTTDIFESSGRSSKFSIRIVDAKFALPKGRAEGESGADAPFVCLDMPEYPGEHDDITIVFDTEAGKCGMPGLLRIYY
jgi:hypothetical protein